MTQLPFRSATELAAAIRGKEISSTELVECCLDRIEAAGRPVRRFYRLAP